MNKEIECEVCNKITKHEIKKDEMDDLEKICIKCGLISEYEENNNE